MEFKSSLTRSRRGGPAKPTQKKYSCSLQMYPTPPDGNVSLSEFDSMAVERLKLLRIIERQNLSGPIKGSDEWVAKIYEDFHKNKNFVISSEKISETKATEVSEARHRDHVSHFILRLAYCRTEDLRRWFVAQEVDLFRARFLHSANTKQEIMAFIKDNDMYFTPISNEEFQEERSNLVDGTHRIGSGDQLEGRTFFKVHFTEALELVRSRRVFLKNGYAYVPDTELVTLIASAFRANLSKALAHTSRALPQLEDDDRLTKLLHDFDRRYTGADHGTKKQNTAAISPAMIDSLATKAFPLCMRRLHEHLTSTHHLKHGGRMQYCLFLKAAGLSLEDALYFWRSHFTKAMDVDKFDKQYAYNIRHNYGKEGKRVDYTSYSCLKIISGGVGPGDAHGCPFKLTDAPVLRQRLHAYGAKSNAVDGIVELSEGGHYQIACQKYWEAVHGAALENGVNHPNQYLEESRKLATLSVTGGPNTPAAPKVDLPSRRSVMQASTPSQSTPVTSSSDSQATHEFDDTDMDMDFDALDAFAVEQEKKELSQRPSVVAE